MRFEVENQYNYPPILRDLSSGHNLVLTTDAEVFLARALLELEARIDVLEKQTRLLLKAFGEKTCEKKSQ